MIKHIVSSPQPLLSGLDQITGAVRRGDPIFLFSDFDGTLAPIVNVPSAAAIDPEIKRVLKELITIPNVVVSVLSGRALDDLKPRVGLPIIYAGNHGLEICGPEFRFNVGEAENQRHRLLSICNELRDRLSDVSGALVECKRLTASVHLRQVAPDDVAKLESVVHETVSARAGFRLHPGRKVIEIRPEVEWNKGTAAKWILHRMKCDHALAICIGDDNTDEDMFRALPTGVSVRVGACASTAAQFWLLESEVCRFLAQILETARLNPTRHSQAIA